MALLETDLKLHAGIIEVLSDPFLRGLLKAAVPLPRPARLASPGLAGAMMRVLNTRQQASRRPPAVHVVRSYLIPLGIALAALLGASSITVDLDDDDEAIARKAGDDTEADAYRRLLGTFLPHVDGVAVASSADASALAERHGIRAPTVVPNGVDIPVDPYREARTPPSLVFVGNLDYPPNVEAAQILARAILPGLHKLADPKPGLLLIGPYSPNGPVAELAALPQVELGGYVEDLSALYRTATAAVVPIQRGSGTKLKLLEAFAHRVPVVTTPVGAAGLGVRHGTHLLIGMNNREIIGNTLELLEKPSIGVRLADQAYKYVIEYYRPEVVADRVRLFLSQATRSEPDFT